MLKSMRENKTRCLIVKDTESGKGIKRRESACLKYWTP